MRYKFLASALLIISYSSFLISETEQKKQQGYIKKTKSIKKTDETEKELKSLLRKNPKDMNIDELRKVRPYAIQTKNFEFAIKCVEQLLLVEQDQEQIRELRLELADLYFDSNDMKKAARAYRIYIDFYQGNKKDLDYAKYKQILCRFYMCLKPPLDQTKTYRTLSLANDYLQNPDTLYAEQVKTIRRNCYDYIFEYEAGIILFNAKAKQPTQERVTELKKELKPVIKEFDGQLLDLEIALAEIENKPTILAAKKAERAEKFPATTMVLAQNGKQRSMRDRF